VVFDERSANLERGHLELPPAQSTASGRERVQTGELLDLVAPLQSGG
jgi:hypothetical protein